jgi:hypothetical protein
VRITRERPKIDRIACPWLIRRFIDPEAKFLFAPTERVFAVAAETGATAYGIPGAAPAMRGACPVTRLQVRFARDSALEGDGFEPSVPVRRTTLFETPLSQHARATAAFENARRPVQQLLPPVVDPVRMNAELTRQLGDRPVPPTAATTTPSL